MKEKILEKVYQKISESVKAKFLLRKEFETELRKFSPKFKERLALLKEEYNQTLEYRKTHLIRISKENYVKYELESYIRAPYPVQEKSPAVLKREYDKLLKNNDPQVLYTFISWLRLHRSKQVDFKCDPLVKNAFYSVIGDVDWERYEFLLTPENLLEKIQEEYFNVYGGAIDLLEMTEKYLNREELPSFSNWVINVEAQGGYITDWVKIFILSAAKNELLMLEISREGLKRRTPYLISKDIQRVDIEKGNTVVTHMHKHFTPEKIIFDTEDEAYQFQKKISEARIPRNFPERKR